MPSEYSGPVLGLLFLRYAEKKFAEVETRIGPVGSGTRRKIGKADYQAEGVIFLTDVARFSYLQNLTEGDNIPDHVQRQLLGHTGPRRPSREGGSQIAAIDLGDLDGYAVRGLARDEGCKAIEY